MAMTLGNHRAKTSASWKKAAYTTRRWRSPALIFGGLAFLNAAAYEWDTVAGFVATGVSLLLIELKPREDTR